MEDEKVGNERFLCSFFILQIFLNPQWKTTDLLLYDTHVLESLLCKPICSLYTILLSDYWVATQWVNSYPWIPFEIQESKTKNHGEIYITAYKEFKVDFPRFSGFSGSLWTLIQSATKKTVLNSPSPSTKFNVPKKEFQQK